MIEVVLGLVATFATYAILIALFHWRDQLRIDREARRVELLIKARAAVGVHTVAPGHVVFLIPDNGAIRLEERDDRILPPAQQSPGEIVDPSYETTRRRVLDLLKLSDELHPGEAERIASQDECERRGIPSTTHNALLQWLAPYGVRAGNRGTYCDAPYPTRPKLYTAILMRTPLPQPNGEGVGAKSQ